MSRPAIGHKPVHAEGTRVMYRWNGEPARPVNAGEYFLSGAPGYEVAYQAGNYHATPRFIAVPVKPDVHLTREEIATMLAALRYWQNHRPSNPELHEIATDGGTLAPLDTHDIDDLCNKINGGLTCES